MSIRCPNCGYEFAQNGLHDCNVFLNGEPVSRVTSNSLNGTTGENTMPQTNNTNNEIVSNVNTGVNTMVNTINSIDMDKFADLVAQRVKANVKAASTQTADGGRFGVNSQFYGKEICGYMYTPFLVPRFLESQYKDMMKHWDSMPTAVRAEVSYMDSIMFMIEECHRLSYMDKISFEERSRFWSVADAREIFTDYFNNLKDLIATEKSKVINAIHKKNRQVTYFKFRNRNYDAHIEFTEGTRDNGSVYSKAVLKVNWTLDKFVEDSLKRLASCFTYGDLYKYMSLVRKDLVRLESKYFKRYAGNGKFNLGTQHKGYELSKVFEEGYLKKGAFYTLCNMVRFEHANVYEYKPTGHSPRVLNGREALDYIKSRLVAGDKAYQFHAMLKRTMNITR